MPSGAKAYKSCRSRQELSDIFFHPCPFFSISFFPKILNSNDYLFSIYSQKSASIQPRRNLYFLAQIDKRSKSLLRFKLRVRSEKCIFGRPRPRSRSLGAEHSQPNSIREHWISVSAESETWLGLPVATGRCRPRSTDPAARPRARGSRGRQPGVAARRAGCPVLFG